MAPFVYFDDTTGITSIPLRSSQIRITPTQVADAKNLFLNIPPILSDPNEVLMTSYSQELLEQKSYILADQLGHEEKNILEYLPNSVYAKLLALTQLKGVGNKNFPVAVLCDEWVNVNPKAPTKVWLQYFPILRLRTGKTLLSGKSFCGGGLGTRFESPLYPDFELILFRSIFRSKTAKIDFRTTCQGLLHEFFQTKQSSPVGKLHMKSNTF